MNETFEILHYASCLNAGFGLDFNDFTLQEQDLISYACSKIKQKNEENKTNIWIKFLSKGFSNLGKGLNAIGKIIGKKKL